jgi:hypothetical protein
MSPASITPRTTRSPLREAAGAGRYRVSISYRVEASLWRPEPLARTRVNGESRPLALDRAHAPVCIQSESPEHGRFLPADGLQTRSCECESFPEKWGAGWKNMRGVES